MIASAPAAGYRFREKGTLMAVGTEGYYWSSSPYVAGDHGAAILGITAGGVTPLGMGRRGVGRSVRCVQHLPTAFCPFLRVAAGGEPGFFGRPDYATARKPV
ncbi:hypothetical protein [uncultured Alistipes sp.]|uniref:hypothetical protein n=1 Tax=uncultured Alistipes sp. TaxID=538949 RepID=UPI00266FE84F|nr:hypothetical protein [uncultured Alistipes sp.]